MTVHIRLPDGTTRETSLDPFTEPLRCGDWVVSRGRPEECPGRIDCGEAANRCRDSLTLVMRAMPEPHPDTPFTLGCDCVEPKPDEHLDDWCAACACRVFGPDRWPNRKTPEQRRMLGHTGLAVPLAEAAFRSLRERP